MYLAAAVAALLVASLARSKRTSYHAVVTAAISALFLSFIVTSAMELR